MHQQNTINGDDKIIRKKYLQSENSDLRFATRDC